MIGWLLGKLAGPLLPYAAGAAVAVMLALSGAVIYYRIVAGSRAEEITILTGRLDALAATLKVTQNANRDLSKAADACTESVEAFRGAADKAQALSALAIRDAQAAAARATGVQRKLEALATQPPSTTLDAACARVRDAVQVWRAR